jgi:ribosomal protein S18 acetylase RimI-like enzyme
MEKARDGSANCWLRETEFQMTVTMTAISRGDREAFLEMAEQHFRSLNPAFVPQEDWKQHYFERILSNSRMSARWIMLDEQRVGFILFGLEDHRFLPRLTGVIYELYVLPGFRRLGVARSCAIQAIKELQAHAPSKIQLEVMEGNRDAEALWRSLGFEKVSERMVLRESPR